MLVESLTTENFRNLANGTVVFSEQMNVIFGDNAQGKTNLIEAIWLFSGAKSFRGAKDSELTAFGEDYTALSLTFRDKERSQTADIRFGGRDKKKVLLNKVPLEGISKLAGSFYTVVFAPSHLSIVSEGPVNRRRFLDNAISQINPRYRDYLDQYEKVLLQRGALLRDCWKFPTLRETIEIWDDQLARLGSILTIYRNDYVTKLGRVASRIYAGLSQGKEQLTISYRSTVFGTQQISVYDDATIKTYGQALSDNLEEDIKAGLTAVGIHRDDLEVEIDGRSARVYGSQGQKRSSALALKLAEASLLEGITGESPVILLDDVMSELDAHRQDYILNHVKNNQVFLTCCDISNTLQLREGKVFHVEKGRIVAQA